nr:chymotrypsin-like protease CTRL-1 [Aedes albopictus]
MASGANSLPNGVSFVIVLGFLISLNLSPIDTSAANAACGKRKINLQQLVTHGYTTNPGEFPWHAALYMKSGFQKSYICGGTLVNELSIVTATHCVVDSSSGHVVSPESLYVQLGKFKLNLYADTVQEHAVLQVITHAEFQPTTSKYDVAVLKLATQAKYTAYVQPICVFPQPVVNFNDGTEKGTVVGWGYTEFDAVADALQATSVPLISYTKCLESNPDLFDRTIYDGMFCAGYTNGTNVCNGDSGGGLYLNRNGLWYLVGIVSFTAAREERTNLCSTHDYTGFTKVAAFEEFIVNSCGLVVPPRVGGSDQSGGVDHPGGIDQAGGKRQKYIYASNFEPHEKMNWFQAGDYCRSIGKHLAEIKSAQDNVKVQDIVRLGGMEIDEYGATKNKQYWIGANDLAKNRVFKWQFSGKRVTFTHWRNNEPNNMHNNEHCVAVLGNKQAFWLDANCRGKRQVLCEYWK